MVYFLKGEITEINLNSIVINVNGIGYLVLVTHPEKFIINNIYKILIHHVIREDDQYYVGFTDPLEKSLFLKLIKVNGLGPKTALSILKNCEPQTIINAIQCRNILFLKQLPNVGVKCANQILLDLGEEFSSISCSSQTYEEAYIALKNLGYKSNSIKKILYLINDPYLSSEDLIKLSITKLTNTN